MFFLYIVTLICSSFSNANDTPFKTKTTVLSPGNDHYNLAGSLYYLRDPNGKLTPESIISGQHDGDFTLTKNNLNLGFTSDIVWVRLQVQRSSQAPSDWVLTLSPYFLDEVTVYVPAQASIDGIAFNHSGGSALPFKERRFNHPYLLTELILPKDKKVAIYLRINTESATILEAKISTWQGVLKSSQEMYLLLGAYYSIMLLVFFPALWRAVWLKDKTSRYYVIYLSIYVGNFLAINGVANMLLFDDNTWLNRILMITTVLLIYLGYFLLGNHLFSIKTSYPRVYRLQKFILAISIIGLPICFLGYRHIVFPLTMPLALIGIATVWWASYKQMRQGYPPATLYFVAFFIPLFAIIITVIKILGGLPHNVFTTNVLQISSAINIVIIHFSMDYARRFDDYVSIDMKQQSLIKARRQVTQARQEQDKLLKGQVRFVDILMHEYRTPISIISANLDILSMLNKKDNDIEVNKRLEVMKKAVARLIDVFERTNEGNDFISKQITENLKVSTTIALIDDCRHTITALFPDRQIKYTNINVSTSVLVACDNSLIRMVFMNLIENAVKYSQADTAIEIECQQHEKNVTVAVKNKGNVISPENRQRIFERYYRETSTQDKPGIGIGLHLCKQIILLHNGNIIAKEWQQGGMIFEMSIPIINEKAE